MRGYFAIGSERISKAMNLGALMRTANAFGASFVFSIDAEHQLKEAYAADTSKTAGQIPYYEYGSVDELNLPRGCQLVGVELTDDAVELPSFRHPSRAAYVLGRERGSLSGEMLARCEFVVRIPTAFCINVATAGAIVMYDRVRALGGFPDRPVRAGGPKPE